MSKSKPNKRPRSTSKKHGRSPLQKVRRNGHSKRMTVNRGFREENLFSGLAGLLRSVLGYPERVQLPKLEKRNAITLKPGKDYTAE